MIEEQEQQQNISACIELLARLRFEKSLIQQFLREDLMRESPLYQEILQQGLQQGESTLIMRLLARQLGGVAPELRSRIQQLPIPQLEERAEALLDFSETQDLVTWLNTHPH